MDSKKSQGILVGIVFMLNLVCVFFSSFPHISGFANIVIGFMQFNKKHDKNNSCSPFCFGTSYHTSLSVSTDILPIFQNIMFKFILFFFQLGRDEDFVGMENDTLPDFAQLEHFINSENDEHSE